MSREAALLAATALKMIHLARLPGMDLIAIQLNCEPTHEELVTALRWQFALETAAAHPTMSPGELARRVLREQPRTER